MKNLIALLSLGVMIIGLGACGKKKGNTYYPPVTGPATDASTITYTDDSGANISWTEASNNISVPISNNNDCVKGLKQDADDQIGTLKYNQLAGLINSSTVVPGSDDDSADKPAPAAENPQLTIEYNNGEVKTYELDATQAAADEEVLTNGDEIISYFDDVEDEIAISGKEDCPGKTYK